MTKNTYCATERDEQLQKMKPVSFLLYMHPLSYVKTTELLCKKAYSEQFALKLCICTVKLSHVQAIHT